MRVLLVRHGESKANVDWNENTEHADHSIPLTDKGHLQAQAAGKFLSGYFCSKFGPDNYKRRVRLWHSPYLRTRQTAQTLCINCKVPEEMGNKSIPTFNVGESWFHDIREHFLLYEQQFGLFDGLSDEQREAKYPDMVAHYEKCKRALGKMWPKMPMGESRADVCQRVHQAFGTFHRDADRHDIQTIVVVAHGTTNRAFTMMWLHKNYEWMHEEPNPKNCSIRLLEDGEDKGYIYAGEE